MALNLKKFWRVYELEKSPKSTGMDYHSDSFDSDSEHWEILSTQVFEFQGKLYVSVLWKTDD